MKHTGVRRRACPGDLLRPLPSPGSAVRDQETLADPIELRRWSDERNDPVRHRPRHHILGECRSDLWHKLARSKMSVSGALLSPRMACHGNRAFGRRLHRLEDLPRQFLRGTVLFNGPEERQSLSVPDRQGLPFWLTPSVVRNIRGGASFCRRAYGLIVLSLYCRNETKYCRVHDPGASPRLPSLVLWFRQRSDSPSWLDCE